MAIWNVLIGLLLLNGKIQAEYFFEPWINWFFGGEEINRIQFSDVNITQINKIPFELSYTHEKFIEETLASFLNEPGQIDRCYHRVLLKLKKSCREMNEEQLMRFSIALLNCQRFSEERPQIECSESMSLGMCLKNMNNEEYSAYQLHQNRAQAICLSVRHRQFEVITKQTVNELLEMAIQQPEQFRDFQRHLTKFTDITKEGMKEVSKQNLNHLNQLQLMIDLAKYHRLQLETAKRNLLSNLIQMDLQLGGSGKSVDSLIKEIEKQTSSLKAFILEMNSAQNKTRKEAYFAFKDIQKLRIDMLNLSEFVGDFNEQLLNDLQNVLTTVKNVNSSVTELIKYFTSSVENQLSWMDPLIARPEILLSLIMFVFYLLLGMIVLAFISANLMSRIIFLASILFNVSLLILCPDWSLGILSFSVSLFLAQIIHLSLTKKELWWDKLFSDKADDDFKTNSQPNFHREQQPAFVRTRYYSRREGSVY